MNSSVPKVHSRLFIPHSSRLCGIGGASRDRTDDLIVANDGVRRTISCICYHLAAGYGPLRSNSEPARLGVASNFSVGPCTTGVRTPGFRVHVCSCLSSLSEGRTTVHLHMTLLGRERLCEVKTVRIEQQRRGTVRGKDVARMKGKTAILLPSTNFYATNFELASISPLFLHQLSRSRWRIDAQVFQTITTDCHLKHPGPPNHRPGGADHDPVSGLYPVPGLFTTAKSAAMPAENATPFTRWPSASPTGSSLFHPTPVEWSRRAWPWSCPAIFPGVRTDALTLYCFRLQKSSPFSIPRAFQLAPASLPGTTGVKSAAYSMGRWHFTESLYLRHQN
jgi:hypothetical protein